MLERIRTLHVLLLVSIYRVTNQQSLLESFLNFVAETGHHRSFEPDDTTKLLHEYDFIIVGAGTAGCVVANRLSENPDWTVLLIEAGGSENYIMDLPMMAHYIQFTSANWRYKPEPSGTYCLGMDNLQCNWPRGKVMGGSSVLNYMIYTRGNRRDYDLWAKLGNKGWSYKNVLPYFKKIERFTIPEKQNPRYHNTTGYVTVGYAPYHTKLAEAVVQASQEYGMKYVDYDGPTQTGVSYLHVSMKDGVRDSSSRAYLHPIAERRNLHVKKMSTVSKVLIDLNTKATQGVEFVQNGKKYQVVVKKEVVVCGGAINSPQLLMLSGIGPQKHLTEMGIPVIKNLKVGYNLMDHVAIGGLTFTIDKPYSVSFNKLTKTEPLIEYLSHHKGPLSIPGGCEVLSFTDLKDPTNPDGYPDIELLYQAGSLTSDVLLHRNFGIRRDVYDTVYKPIEGKDAYMVFPMLMRPKSKGRIVLKNKNYLSKPKIFPNYFAYKEDMDTLVEGIKLAINVSQMPALQKIGTRLHSIPVPGCTHLEFGTNQYWECKARHLTFTIYHLSGTCKMGPKSDKNAVVDPRLRVYGIKGLRVVDASIMPEVPAGHTNAPVFMVAEKGSDMIKEDWGWL